MPSRRQFISVGAGSAAVVPGPAVVYAEDTSARVRPVLGDVTTQDFNTLAAIVDALTARVDQLETHLAELGNVLTWNPT